MPLLDFAAIAGQLPATWKSTRLGQVGPARIKVLRMMDGVRGAGHEPVVMGTLREVLDAAE